MSGEFFSEGQVKRKKIFDVIKKFHDDFNEDGAFDSRDLYLLFLLSGGNFEKSILPRTFFQLFSCLIKKEKKFFILKRKGAGSRKWFGIVSRCFDYADNETIERYKIENRERIRWNY
jgi:hypothetical protein